MIFQKYINDIGSFLLKILIKLNDYKAGIYIIFFCLYFFLYFTMTLPKLARDTDNNLVLSFIKNLKSKWIFLIPIGIFDLLGLISIIWTLVYYFKNKSKMSNFKELLFIAGPIAIVAILLFINILIFSNSLNFIAESKITKYIYFSILIPFYIIFISIFIYDINNQFNIEFFISLIILGIFWSEYMIIYFSSLFKIYFELKNNNFTLLTVNCFNDNNNEQFKNDNSNNNIQILQIEEKYGDNYLKTIGNIPVEFYNKNNKQYNDLILADFYYPGSYYTYLSDSPLNGTPDLKAIELALSKFKVRIIHLDIFSDKNDEYDPSAIPIVRCKNMAQGAKPLSLDDIFTLINKWAWITEEPNTLSYPFFLYLNFNFNADNESLNIKIYDLLIKYFSKYLVDKKYSFLGRNSSFNISMASIKECLGKIIIITSVYPTKTVLDELINASSNNLNTHFTLNVYKENYVTYDKVGISQDNDKTSLVSNSLTNFNIYYSDPNTNYKNNSQVKSGLYNPSFQDCAQYGIQATLMYLYVPDNNLNKWITFFKNKNNLDPVLKDESLRYKIKGNTTINSQDSVVGLQKPQKYCIIPGLISTEKSNLSGKVTNPSCNS
jgi:hypothetical protein